MRFTPQRARMQDDAGLTLLELILSVMILLVLSTAALPVVRFTVVRQKEWELRRDLREIRTAIDRYKDLADRHFIATAVGSNGYPADLDTLVQGVGLGVAGPDKVRFLRRVPIDPMTGHADWVILSMEDDPGSTGGSSDYVFDVHSKSEAKALDGTAYSSW